jgi:energy-coupling factor transporter ATP-binding protein EcfA2
MLFRFLEVENVRSMTFGRLDFGAPDGSERKWTLLLGQNGVGKSTLLRAAALLRAGSESLVELLGTPDSWVRNRQKQAVIRAEFVTAEGDHRPVELAIRRGQTLADVLRTNSVTLEALDRALAHSARNYMTVGYGVSRRTAAAGQTAWQRFQTPRARAVATLFDAEAGLHSIEAWAMDLHYRRRASGLRTIRESLDGLLPGIQFSHIDREARVLYFDTPDGPVPFEQLSDGYQNVAAWCGDLLYRLMEVFADYRRPLEARGVLLIDEIDLHLHPVWQRQLRRFLQERFPQLQVVATTHSALTAHQAGAGELVLLRREGPSAPTTLLPFPGEPRRMLLHQLLASPLFGLDTLESDWSDSRRQQYEHLRGRKRLTKSERAALAGLREELRQGPDWTTASFSDQKQVQLLRRIAEALPETAKTKRGGAA